MLFHTNLSVKFFYYVRPMAVTKEVQEKLTNFGFWLTRPQGGLGLWNDCFLYPAAFLHWPSHTGEKWERNSKCRVDYRSRQPWRIKVSYFRRYEIIEPYPFPPRLFKIVLVPMGASMLCWQRYNQFLILKMIWVIQIRGQDMYALSFNVPISLGNFIHVNISFIMFMIARMLV